MDFAFYFKKIYQENEYTRDKKKYKASKMWHDVEIAEQQKAKKGRDDCIELFSIESTYIVQTTFP